MTALMSWCRQVQTPKLASGTSNLEVVAAQTVPDIEVIADDGKPHRVGAKKKASVFDGVKISDVEWNFYRTPTVPTDTVT